MNRSKKIYILLGILAVSCIAALAVIQFEERIERIKNSDEIILEVSRDSVQSLSWEYNGNTLAFHRDGTWLYDGDDAFPVSEDRINELLSQFEAFGVSFIIEDVEDYGQYGLNNPVCTIALTTDEQAYEILLGNYSSMDSKRYVSIGDGNVYLVQNDPLDVFDTGLSDMIANDEIPVFGKVTGIQFAGNENYSIVREEDSVSTYSAGDIYFVQRNGKNLPLDTSRVDAYLQAISNLSPASYVSYNASDEELPAYGLDNPDLTVTVNYAAEDGNDAPNTFVLHISRSPEEKLAAETGQEDSADETVTAYARIGESQIIYQISSGSCKTLLSASYDDFRHQEVIWADFADIQQIVISLEETDYAITSETDGDSRIYLYRDEEIDISDFQDALSELRADSFVSERPAQKRKLV